MHLKDLPFPLNVYRFVNQSDQLHFGCWPPERPDLSVPEAQAVMSGKLLGKLPSPPLRILDVGCGLGASAGALAAQRYDVTALAPSEILIAYAEAHHPGPRYLIAGFMDAQPELEAEDAYDVVLFQESLQYLPDLGAALRRVRKLLAPGGRLLIGDEVSYDEATRAHSAVHTAREIERHLGEQGFFVRRHKRLGIQVRPTCEQAVQRFAAQRAELLAGFCDAAQLDALQQGWQRQLEWYGSGRFGYELWEARHDGFITRAACSEEAARIIDTFQRVFQAPRTLEHWQWKFRDNPWGRELISVVWRDGDLLAHYAGYPVRFQYTLPDEIPPPPSFSKGGTKPVYHVGDTFTAPALRGVGRGQTSLLGRAFRHFERQYCEQQILFGYGFNTGKIQRFGKLFLGYAAVKPVYEWLLSGESLNLLQHTAPTWRMRLRGYHVMVTEQAGDWADQVWRRAYSGYPWLTVRERDYLCWRYQRHPDFQHTFFLALHLGRPVGWWVGRIQDQALYLGDALFTQAYALRGARSALLAALRHYARQGVEIREVRSWFAETPQWWEHILARNGFVKQRQFQNLDLAVKSYTPGLTEEEIGARFYFAWGDSDLF